MQIKNKQIFKISFLFVIFFFFFPLIVDAQLLNPGTGTEIQNQASIAVGDTSPDNTPDPRLIAFYLIQVFLSVLGTVFLGLTLLSGYFFFTARGREEMIIKAQDTMRRAIIGLIVIFAAFAITRFAIINIQGAVNQGADYYAERQYGN